MQARSKIVLATLLFGLTWTSSAALGQAGSDSLEARFRREAPGAWANLEKDDDAIEMQGVKQENINGGLPWNFHFARSGSRIFLESYSESRGWGNVLCIAENRGFILDRKRPRAPYAITHIGDNSLKMMRGRIDDGFPEWDRRLIQKPIGMKLSGLLNDPTYRITGVEPVSLLGKDLARIRYSRKPTEEDRRRGARDGVGEAVLDPSHQWVILRSVIRYSGLGDITTTFEYGEDEDGRPTLKRYHDEQEETLGNGEPFTNRTDLNFTKFSHRPLPPAAFSLAGFGLPDLDRPIGKRPDAGYNYWLLGLGLLFAAIAVVTRVRRSTVSA